MDPPKEECLRVWDLLDSNGKEEWLALGIQIAERKKTVELPLITCLFCPTQADGLDSILLHMTVTHAFSIPDMEYCNNVEGLLDFLRNKVNERILCLWCDEKRKAFPDAASVQVDKKTENIYFCSFHDNK